MRACDVVSDVKPQPETRTLVRIHVCLRMDSTSQRIEDGASFPHSGIAGPRLRTPMVTLSACFPSRVMFTEVPRYPCWAALPTRFETRCSMRDASDWPAQSPSPPTEMGRSGWAVRTVGALTSQSPQRLSHRLDETNTYRWGRNFAASGRNDGARATTCVILLESELW